MSNEADCRTAPATLGLKKYVKDNKILKLDMGGQPQSLD